MWEENHGKNMWDELRRRIIQVGYDDDGEASTVLAAAGYRVMKCDQQKA